MLIGWLLYSQISPSSTTNQDSIIRDCTDSTEIEKPLHRIGFFDKMTGGCASYSPLSLVLASKESD